MLRPDILVAGVCVTEMGCIAALRQAACAMMAIWGRFVYRIFLPFSVQAVCPAAAVLGRCGMLKALLLERAMLPYPGAAER